MKKFNSQRKRLFSTLFIFLSIILILFVTELTLRTVGYSANNIHQINLKVKPEGLFFQPDAELGYYNQPGAFIITYPDDFNFRCTNLPNGLRITQPLEKYQDSISKQSIWIFGCSFTYGWALNDEETFLWKVQESFPELDIENYGVAGYSNVQNLIQFEKALQTSSKPKAVYLAYAGFHDQRNISTRWWRKNLSSNNNLGLVNYPFARIDDKNKLQIKSKDISWFHLPILNNLALTNQLELAYERWEISHYKSRLVTEAIITRFNKLCQSNNIDFYLMTIAPISNPGMIRKFCDDSGIPNFDIAVDLNENKYNNLPHDNHPNALANKIYAERMTAFMKENLKD